MSNKRIDSVNGTNSADSTNGVNGADSTDAVPGRASGFSNGEKFQASAVDPRSSSPLDQRLRQGSDNFQFDALLKGVSTLDKVPPQPPLPDAALPREPAVQTVAKPYPNDKEKLIRTVGVSVLASIVVAVLTVIYFNRLSQRVVSPSPVASTSVDSPRSLARRGLPDPVLSPGEYSNGLLSRRMRGASNAIPAAMEQQVLRAYGITPDEKGFVVCHVVPPQLGGTTSAKNLFPTTPWFRDLKRRLDARLIALVNEGKLSVPKAQKELTTNWVKSMHRYPVRNYGRSSSDEAEKVEMSISWDR